MVLDGTWDTSDVSQIFVLFLTRAQNILQTKPDPEPRAPTIMGGTSRLASLSPSISSHCHPVSPPPHPPGPKEQDPGLTRAGLRRRVQEAGRWFPGPPCTCHVNEEVTTN